MDDRTDAEIRTDLSYLFDKGSQVLAARMSAALAELDVTARGYCVLSKALAGDRTQGELAEIALLDKTTMVVTMDHLEALGWARRVPSSTDRRVRMVQTTDAGRAVVERARTIIDDLYAEVLGALSGPQREGLLDALATLVGRGGPLADPDLSPLPRRPRRSSRTG